MDYLWTPWRYAYVSQPGPDGACIFCEALKRNRDDETLILFRGRLNFIILNRYPYTTGHAMVAPFAPSSPPCAKGATMAWPVV